MKLISLLPFTSMYKAAPQTITQRKDTQHKVRQLNQQRKTQPSATYARTLLLLALSISPSLLWAESVTTKSETKASTRIPKAILSLGDVRQLQTPYVLLVDKKERRLSIWTQNNEKGLQQIKEFPADVGRRDGDKTSSGDQKTPEGVYFLKESLEGSQLDFRLYGRRAFTTNYPNYFDEKEGKTGSGIWLHAVPDDVPLTRGSRGCVVVRNNVIDELTQIITLRKTPLLILSSMEWTTPEEVNSQKTALDQFIADWKDAWEKKDIERYMKYYAEDFESLHMDKAKWKKFKSGLNAKYSHIELQFSSPLLLSDKAEHITARFLQSYKSDQHSDFGEKTLYIRNISAANRTRSKLGHNNSILNNSSQSKYAFEIIGEEWKDEIPTPAQLEMRTAAASTNSEPAADRNTSTVNVSTPARRTTATATTDSTSANPPTSSHN